MFLKFLSDDKVIVRENQRAPRALFTGRLEPSLQGAMSAGAGPARQHHALKINHQSKYKTLPVAINCIIQSVSEGNCHVSGKGPLD
jgi:hypothetical protein